MTSEYEYEYGNFVTIDDRRAMLNQAMAEIKALNLGTMTQHQLWEIVANAIDLPTDICPKIERVTNEEIVEYREYVAPISTPIELIDLGDFTG